MYLARYLHGYYSCKFSKPGQLDRILNLITAVVQLLGVLRQYQGMYTRAVHSTACGTIQLTTKYTNSKICYQICYEIIIHALVRLC
eukprot:SAG31_NODE_1357_length_8647_cov_8.257838_1_plen_86_part_00